MVRNKSEYSEKHSLKNFFKSSTLISLKHLHRDDTIIGKFVWVWINVLILGGTVFVVLSIWDKSTHNPTFTTLESTNYPISKVPFPGISICNLNKISKKKAENVASFISETTGAAFEEIHDYMKTLGSFYDYDDTNSHKQLQFQKILEKFDHVNEFQPVQLMKWLSPTCEEFLLHCTWKNQEVNCSEIFQLRLTFEGYCCIFNYVKDTNEVTSKTFLNNEITFGEAGLESGLTVELNNQLNDYFYTKHASLGANIHIFNPTDYPDKNSGSLTEQLVEISTEFLIQLETTTYRAVQDVIRYPVEKRKCYFVFEKKTSFGFYSESDCLMDCRIESMTALCGCVPFMIPQNRSLVCGLSDIQCLSKYRVKWEALAPPDDIYLKDKLKREAHYALHCKDRCYPGCTTYTYQITTNPTPIKNPVFGNNSVLRIYYNDHESFKYKVDVYYYWFEIMGRFGGACSIILSVSIVTIVEIIVFCVQKVHNYVHQVSCNEHCCVFCAWSF